MQGKKQVQDEIGLHGSACHLLKSGRESFMPISKCNNRDNEIAFDSLLKTALIHYYLISFFQSLFLTHNRFLFHFLNNGRYFTITPPKKHTVNTIICVCSITVSVAI